MKRSFSGHPFFRNYLLYACCMLVLISLVSFTYAWLFQDKTREYDLTTTNVALKTNVYFAQSDGTTVSAAAYKDAQTGYYALNITDPTALNYAPKLRVDLTYQGVTHSFLRVLVSDMWYVKNTASSGTSSGTSSALQASSGYTAIFKADTVFLTPQGQWMDNRIYDDCYYYMSGTGNDKGIVYGKTPDQVQTIPFITGIQDFARIANGKLYIQIRGESVQVNRLAAFWNTSALPSGYGSVAPVLPGGSSSSTAS